MSHKKMFFLLVAAVATVALALPAAAQDEMGTPSVEVSDQLVLDGTVTIDSTYSEGPGFIVIHADNGQGAPGPVIGHRALRAGQSQAVTVPIDAAAATPTLFAMLHTDTGEVGTYEFGTVEGADSPVRVDDQVVTPSFAIDAINAMDQFVDGGSVTIASVTAQQPGWLVVHADGDNGPGAVLGQTQVDAGTTADVSVALSGDATAILWPMLHVDTGEAGTYEFGTVEGADGPVGVNGNVAVTRIWTAPHVRVDPQIVTHGEGMDMGDMGEMAPTLVAKSVLSEGPGWLVVHAAGDNGPGPVLGQTAVSAGLNMDVAVELDASGLTPVLWPMLHVDTGEVGTYEFGTVEGADSPVSVNDNVVTFPVNTAPSLSMQDQALDMNSLRLDSVLIDAPGWIAVHSSQDGGPGPVIATYPLNAGLNQHIHIPVDPAEAGQQVFPMLHYDTGEAGVYEFGTVEGADSPVSVGGSVVVGPLNLAAGEDNDMMGGEEGEDTMSEGEEDTSEGESAEGEDTMSEGGEMSSLDGDALVSERCTVCHSRDRIDNADKTEDEWAATVDRMIGYGAQLSEEERAAVIAYLAATH